MQNKNVLVTGISGFLGSHLTRKLLSSNANVTGLIRSVNDTHNKDILAKSNIYLGDVTDLNLLKEIISTNEITHIIHLAAYSIVKIASRDPYNCFNTNVMGTVSVLEAVRQVGGVESILISTSDKAYGDSEVLPYSENTPLNPKNSYDASKGSADIISRTYRSNYGLPATVVRCSNIFGEGDNNTSRIVPQTILRLLDGKPPLLYKDIENMERELIYVSDVVDGYIKLAENKPEHDVYNIGSNSPIKIVELVKLISKLVTGKEIEPEYKERESTFKEIQKQCIDYSRIKLEFGWEPKVNLEEGLTKTIEWYKNEK